MKTTLDKLLKACLNTRLEIVRFKAGWGKEEQEEYGREGEMASRIIKTDELHPDVIQFLDVVSSTLLDMHDDVVELKEELER